MNILNLKKSGQSEFFRSKKPNQIWLSDITYIHTIKHGWTYLASVLDVCTRKNRRLQLWKKKMDRSLVISALTNSWQNQNYPDNVILHSDRGSQYTSSEYIAVAERMGFRLSYSKKGAVLLITLPWNPFILF